MPQITFDFAKVQWIAFHWTNGAINVAKKPRVPTANGILLDKTSLAGSLADFPGETLLERAKRRNLIDVWTPVVKIVFTANKHLRFTGRRALTIWREWNRRQYNGKTK